jgi:tetratricopeptide (TPR) repeat protein
VILQEIQDRKYTEAREKLLQATKNAPQDVGLWRQLAELDVRLRDTDGAIAAFQRVRSLTPREAGVYFDLGALFAQKGDPAEALNMYSQGLALDPRNEESNRNYAYLLMQGEKSCEAVAPLVRLKRMKGGDLSVRASLIESQLKCGNDQAGKRELEEFLQLHAATVEDRMKLARVLGKDHRPDAAEETLQNITETAPDFAEAHADLGLILLQKNRFEDAARQLGRAVQLEPSSSRYSMDLAQVLLKAKQYPTALQFLQGAKGRFGSLPEYEYKLAWANYGLGDVPQATAQLEALVQRHPELDLAQYSLGNCYVALGRLPEAETQYRAAIAKNPKNGSYHSALGLVLRKKSIDGVDEAMAELGKALQLNPADLETQVQLAICYEQKAALPAAARLLEAAVHEQPGMAEAHRVLARVYYRQGRKVQGDQESATVLKLDSEREARGRSQVTDPSAQPSFR